MHIVALSDAAICIGQRNYMRASGQIFEEFCLTSCPKHIVFMEELKEIYERMTFLRQKGIKMKDMAERAGFSPSVLSAIYSTVLPAYFKNLEKGMSEEEALHNALVWVNNVSKKKLLGSLVRLKDSLFSTDYQAKAVHEDTRCPFLAQLENNMQETMGRIFNFSGIYTSYSISSGSRSLKIEPYLIAPSESGNYVEVGHNNAYGVTHWGTALMNGFNHLYLMFNENPSPQLSLFYICLKLPMYDRPPFLRGLYLCFDYNYNPVARRILFVKHSDSVARDEFLKLKGELKALEALDEKEKMYYDYTCQAEDIIRMCNIPSPRMTEEDLIVEKKILSL